MIKLYIFESVSDARDFEGLRDDNDLSNRESEPKRTPEKKEFIKRILRKAKLKHGSGRRAVHCKSCGETGHTKKTCPTTVASDEAVDHIDRIMED
jgi:hypothetical protein